MTIRSTQAHLVRWSSALEASGINATELTGTMAAEISFGNSAASFGCDDLILHLTSDRGQEFIDIGPAHSPGEHFRLEDIELAFGWTDLAELLTRTAPRPLPTQLAEIVNHRDELARALSIENIAAVRASIERAKTQYGSALREKLQSVLPR